MANGFTIQGSGNTPVSGMDDNGNIWGSGFISAPTLRVGQTANLPGAIVNASGWLFPFTPLGFAAFQSATSISNGNTIDSGTSLTKVTTSADVTGIIIGGGTLDGQMLAVLNESANTLTMAASGTSHVADGTSDVIAATSTALYFWEGNDTSLWYRVK